MAQKQFLPLLIVGIAMNEVLEQIWAINVQGIRHLSSPVRHFALCPHVILQIRRLIVFHQTLQEKSWKKSQWGSLNQLLVDALVLNPLLGSATARLPSGSLLVQIQPPSLPKDLIHLQIYLRGHWQTTSRPMLHSILGHSRAHPLQWGHVLV